MRRKRLPRAHVMLTIDHDHNLLHYTLKSFNVLATIVVVTMWLARVLLREAVSSLVRLYLTRTG